jgi:hypothetical protein
VMPWVFVSPILLVTNVEHTSQGHLDYLKKSMGMPRPFLGGDKHVPMPLVAIPWDINVHAHMFKPSLLSNAVQGNQGSFR